MLKKPIYFLTLCIVSLQVAPARSDLRFGLSDEWMQRKVQPPTEPLSFDAAAISLARANAANVFADVTQVDAKLIFPSFLEGQPQERALAPTTAAVFLNLSGRAGMRLQRSGQNTLLFWRKPETNRILDLINEYDSAIDKQYPQSEEQATLVGLRDFYVNNHGFKAEATTVAEAQQRAKGLDKSIPLSEFPPALNAALKRELIEQVQSNGGLSSLKMINPSFWSDARVKSVTENATLAPGDGGLARPNPVQHLYLSNSRPEIPIYSIGIADVQPGDPRQLETLGEDEPDEFQKIAALNRIYVRSPLVDSHVAGDFGEGVPSDELNSPAVQVSVKFTAQHQPLTDFIKDLERQAKVNLHLAPKAFDAALLTAHSDGMLLREAMASLAELYMSRWVKVDDGYKLLPQKLDELQQLMVQQGVAAYFQFSDTDAAHRAIDGTKVANELIQAGPIGEMKSREGLLFSSLAKPLQESVLKLMHGDKAPQIIVAHQRVTDALSQDVQIRFAPLPKRTPRFYGKFMSFSAPISGPLEQGFAGLAAFTADGRVITQLFPKFFVRQPTAKELRTMTDANAGDVAAAQNGTAND